VIAQYFAAESRLFSHGRFFVVGVCGLPLGGLQIFVGTGEGFNRNSYELIRNRCALTGGAHHAAAE